MRPHTHYIPTEGEKKCGFLEEKWKERKVEISAPPLERRQQQQQRRRRRLQNTCVKRRGGCSMHLLQRPWIGFTCSSSLWAFCTKIFGLGIINGQTYFPSSRKNTLK